MASKEAKDSQMDDPECDGVGSGRKEAVATGQEASQESGIGPDEDDTAKSLPTSYRKDKEHVAEIKQKLGDWRWKLWEENFSIQPWGPEALMPDAILERISGRRVTGDGAPDYARAPFRWSMADQYGRDVVTIVSEIDSRYDVLREGRLREELEEKEKAKAEKRAVRAEEREKKKVEKQRMAKEAREQQEVGRH